MRRGTVTCVALSLAVGASALALTVQAGAAPSHARVTAESGGFSYVSVGDTTAAGTFDVLTADCPGQTHVWGGGEVNDAGYEEFQLRQSHPLDDADNDAKPDDGWSIGVVTPAAEAVTVQAVCAKPMPRYVTQDLAIFPGNIGFFKVKCPRGTNVSGGGVEGPPQIVASSSSPPTEVSWGLDVENLMPLGNADAFVAHAVCPSRDLTDAPQDVLVQRRDADLPAQAETPKTVRCRHGRLAVGGGFHPNGSYLETFANGAGFVDDSRFAVSVDNTVPEARLLGAFALCSVPLK